MKLNEKAATMSQSLFKNFDPDELKPGFNANTNISLRLGRQVWMVVVQLLDVCARFHTYENAEGLYTLSNDQFSQLWTCVKDFAEIGLKNKDVAGWPVELICDGREREEIRIINLALHGANYQSSQGTARSQIHGLAGLFLIDDAMTMALSGGITVEVVDLLSAASFNLAEARFYEHRQPEFKKYFQSINSSDIELELKRRESRAASIRASIRHEFGNSAKDFVRQEWEAHKSEYGNNKSAFARHYVPIVSHKFSKKDGDPINITHKQMRDVWLADHPPTR
jgi:hypothetical protein